MLGISTIRKTLKLWLYSYCPGLTGSFPYFGTKVYFPENSLLFKLACQQGVYECDNLILINRLIKPNSVYFDIGANIGLMSVPVLPTHSDCTVVSVEPSPNALPFLQKTQQESRFTDRWKIVEQAIDNEVGTKDFAIAAAELGAFDGFKDTQRVPLKTKVTVSTTTLDREWEAMGKPLVSVIKLDVEGSEIQVLQGGLHCIEQTKPYILLEWTALNLSMYGYSSSDLVALVQEMRYELFSVPSLLPIRTTAQLNLQMLKTESFLLAPSLE